MIGLFQISDVWSQPFWLPTTGDTQVTTWPSNGVQNTGTAAVGDLHAIVWDGDNPGLAVHNYNTGLTATTAFTFDGVYDPDVVINPIYTNMILVVYTIDPTLGIGQTVRYEYYEYVASTNTLINRVASTRITSGPAVESYPNVDVAEDGWSYVVWQDTVQNEIYAARLVPGTSSTFPPFPIINVILPLSGIIYIPTSTCYTRGETLRKPDISTRFNIFTGAKINTLVYEIVDLANNTSEIVSTRFNDNEYFISSVICPNILVLDQVDLRLGMRTDPRVSAQGWPGADASDANVTWAAWDINVFPLEMRSITSAGGSWGGIQSLNQPTVDLRNEPNRRPVTSYSGDLLINAWDYDDANAGIVRGVAEPLARQLDFGGALWSFDYSVIPFNRTPASDYTNISIDGRYAAGFTNYAFYMPSNGQMFVKRSLYFNQSLRQKPNVSNSSTASMHEFKVYPTKVVDYTLVEGASTLLNITDIHGKNVPAAVEKTDSGFKVTGIENWATGMYILRAQVGNEVKVVKLIK